MLKIKRFATSLSSHPFCLSLFSKCNVTYDQGFWYSLDIRVQLKFWDWIQYDHKSRRTFDKHFKNQSQIFQFHAGLSLQVWCFYGARTEGCTQWLDYKAMISKTAKWPTMAFFRPTVNACYTHGIVSSRTNLHLTRDCKIRPQQSHVGGDGLQQLFIAAA